MFINETGTVALLLTNMDQTVTGSMLLTFGLLLFFLILIAVIFRLPAEVFILFLTPIGLVMMSYKGELMVFGVLILIIDGFILAKALINLFNG